MSNPRWCSRELLHPLERQIHDLACEVEQAGAHPLLTKASTALFDAVRILVEWFDSGQPGNDWENGNRPLTLEDEALVRQSWERLKPYFAMEPYGGTPSADTHPKDEGAECGE